MTSSGPSQGDGSPRLDMGDHRGTIHGVVVRGGFYVNPGRRFWTRRIKFWLTAWRRDEQPVEMEPVLAVHEVPLGTVWSWRRKIVSGQAVSFVCAGTEAASSTNPRLLVGRFLGPSADPEVLAAAAPLFRPDTRTTAEFGTLVWEPGGAAEGYVGRCAWHGPTVTLELAMEDRGGLGRSLEHARALHAAWSEWEARLLALIERELLPIWEDWHADEAPIDAETLYRRFTLESISVDNDGSVRMMLDAGGQFTDHEIVAYGTVADGPEDIYPEG